MEFLANIRIRAGAKLAINGNRIDNNPAAFVARPVSLDGYSGVYEFVDEAGRRGRVHRSFVSIVW